VVCLVGGVVLSCGEGIRNLNHSDVDQRQLGSPHLSYEVHRLRFRKRPRCERTPELNAGPTSAFGVIYRRHAR
jgi:hypothetical protein